jgi:hypothetical protein
MGAIVGSRLPKQTMTEPRCWSQRVRDVGIVESPDVKRDDEGEQQLPEGEAARHLGSLSDVVADGDCSSSQSSAIFAAPVIGWRVSGSDLHEPLLAGE